MKTRNPFLDESITIEDEKVFLWLGGLPYSKTASKIDVTMAFNIGLKIGQNKFSEIQTYPIKINL